MIIVRFLTSLPDMALPLSLAPAVAHVMSRGPYLKLSSSLIRTLYTPSTTSVVSPYGEF